MLHHLTFLNAEDLMKWYKENPLCSSIHFFKEVQERQFLKDKDCIDNLLFRYYVGYDFPIIVEVNKYKKRYFKEEPLRKLEEAFKFYYDRIRQIFLNAFFLTPL